MRDEWEIEKSKHRMNERKVFTIQLRETNNNKNNNLFLVYFNIRYIMKTVQNQQKKRIKV